MAAKIYGGGSDGGSLENAGAQFWLHAQRKNKWAPDPYLYSMAKVEGLELTEEEQKAYEKFCADDPERMQQLYERCVREFEYRNRR